jgi:hypothetical protein
MADQDEHVNIIVSVDDKASKPLRDINESIRGTKSEAQGLSEVFGPLKAGADKFAESIGIPSKAVDAFGEAFHKAKAPVGDLALAVKGMASTAVADIGGLAKTIGVAVDTVGILTASLRLAGVAAGAAGIAIAAMGKALSDNAKGAEDLKYLQGTAHLTAETLIQMQRVAENMGIPPEQVASMTNYLAHMRQGIAENVPEFTKMMNELAARGPEAKAISDAIVKAAQDPLVSQEEYVNVVEEGLASIENLAHRIDLAKAIKIPGPEAAARLLGGFREEAAKLPPPVLPDFAALQQYETQVNILTASFKNLRQSVMNALAPTGAVWMTELNDFLEKNKGEIGANLISFMSNLAKTLADIAHLGIQAKEAYDWITKLPTTAPDWLRSAPHGREIPLKGGGTVREGSAMEPYFRALHLIDTETDEAQLKAAAARHARRRYRATVPLIERQRPGTEPVLPQIPAEATAPAEATMQPKSEPTSVGESQPPPVQQTQPTAENPLAVEAAARAKAAAEGRRRLEEHLRQQQAGKTAAAEAPATFAERFGTLPAVPAETIAAEAPATFAERFGTLPAVPETPKPAAAAEAPATFDERFGALPAAVDQFGTSVGKFGEIIDQLGAAKPSAEAATPEDRKVSPQNFEQDGGKNPLLQLANFMSGPRTPQIRLPSPWTSDEPSWPVPAPGERGRHGPGDLPAPPTGRPTSAGPGDEFDPIPYFDRWKNFPKSSNIEDRRKFGPFDPLPAPPDLGKFWEDFNKAQLKEGEARRQREAAGQSTGFDKLSEGADKFLRGITSPAGASQGMKPYSAGDPNASKLPLDTPQIDDRSLAQMLESSLAAHAGTTRVEGSAKLTVDVNAPRGTLVKASTGGDLFKEVELNRSSQMAMADDTA